jgi:peptidoglycan/LPS O-acetylase OafA/YrhL
MFEGLRIKLGKLPWRLKRALGNMSYSLHLSGGPSTRRIKPSTTLTIIIALAVVGFILAGGVYDLLEHPISLLPTPTGYSVLISGTLGEQTLNESLIAGFLYMLGLGGLYMLLRSTRFAYRPRNAYLLLMIGTFTVLMVVYYSNALMSAKLGS